MERGRTSLYHRASVKNCLRRMPGRLADAEGQGAATVVAVLTELFAGVGSLAVLATEAVVVTDPVTEIATVTVNDVDAPGAMSPSAQVTVCPTALQVAPAAETKLNPVGSTMVVTTDVASDGPALLTFSEYTPPAPDRNVPDAFSVTARLAEATSVAVSVPVSLVASESLVEVATDAETATVPTPDDRTFTESDTDRDDPAAIGLTRQVTVAPAAVQPEPDRKVSPAGNTNVSTTSAADAVPAL